MSNFIYAASGIATLQASELSKIILMQFVCKFHYNNFRQLTCLQSGDTRCCIDTIRPPEEEQRTARNR
jgi:hypothetical protein